MQLLSLFTIPFDIRSVSYLQDFELEAPNLERFPHSVRGRPKRWTLDNVADSFQIPSVGKIVVSRKVSYASKFFTGHRNPRHGWNISQCSSPALQAVLMFLMPIFHPRKPSYAPIGLLNTVVGSWKKGILVNWGQLLRTVILKEIEDLKPGKKTFLQCYLAQIYWYHRCLLPEEQSERAARKEDIDYITGGEEDPTEEVPLSPTEALTPVFEQEELPDDVADPTPEVEAEDLVNSRKTEVESDIVTEPLGATTLEHQSAGTPQHPNATALSEEELQHTPYASRGIQSPTQESEGCRGRVQQKITDKQDREDLLWYEQIVEDLGEILQCRVDDIVPTVLHLLKQQRPREVSPLMDDQDVEMPTTPTSQPHQSEERSLSEAEPEQIACQDICKDDQQLLDQLFTPPRAPSTDVTMEEAVKEDDDLLDSPISVDDVLPPPTYEKFTAEDFEEQAAPHQEAPSIPIPLSPMHQQLPCLTLQLYQPLSFPSSSSASPIPDEPPASETPVSSPPIPPPPPQSTPPPPPENTVQATGTHIIPPLNSVQPQISRQDEWDPSRWRFRYDQMVDEAIEARTRFLPPVVAIIAGRRYKNFVPTYIPGSNSIPVDDDRKLTCDAFDLWCWVYHCRRIHSPFPALHPDFPWPFAYYTWIGPDGMLIPARKERLLEERRMNLLSYMKLKTPQAKGRQMIGSLFKLPLLKIKPDIISGGFGLGI